MAHAPLYFDFLLPKRENKKMEAEEGKLEHDAPRPPMSSMFRVETQDRERQGFQEPRARLDLQLTKFACTEMFDDGLRLQFVVTWRTHCCT